jgi:hypothetical protein
MRKVPDDLPHMPGAANCTVVAAVARLPTQVLTSIERSLSNCGPSSAERRLLAAAGRVPGCAILTTLADLPTLADDRPRPPH